MLTPISTEEKRQAVARLLQCRALGRSEQLRALLSYICEAELDGRAHEINEYALGVAVLGRPVNYSPAEDSCVRSRAYELRSRLRAYYEGEAPDDPIRIEIDKGGYVPRFERTLDAPKPDGSRHRVDEGVLTAELRSLWQPFIASDAPLLIAFDVRPFFYAPPTGLVVRDYRINDARDVAKSEPLTRFQARMEVPELLETRDYADFGAVHAAFVLGRLLSCTRRDVGLKHSSSLDWQDIWNSNLVFIGKPRVNAIIRSCLEGKEFAEDDFGVIHNLRPRPGEAAEYRGVTTHGMGDKYGVITRVPGPQSGRHMLLLNGPAAELMWALAECVTNPEHVAELMAHLRTSSGEYAETFQAIIKATFQSNVPVKIEYVAYRILSSP